MLSHIEHIESKKLIGKRIRMSLLNNRTVELWRGFMPERGTIKNRISEDLISMQVYDSNYDLSDLDLEFEKWAVVEVTDFDSIPASMEPFILEAGLYAVFKYKGSSSDELIFTYIFGTWLPHSEYELDYRPHFEVLGDKYKNDDPESEEEIWIPVKLKQPRFIQKNGA
jgi:AraC family transcriptional regulator